MVALMNVPRGKRFALVVVVSALGGLFLTSLLFTGLPTRASTEQPLPKDQQSGSLELTSTPIPPTFTPTPVPAGRFCNSTEIIIRDHGTAVPYPSSIDVSGLAGTVTNVTVNLNGFGHDFYGDVDILLVGPQGQKVVLMSDVCETCGIGGRYLTFADGAPPLKDSRACPDVNGTYRPTDYPGYFEFVPDDFPPPATTVHGTGWAHALDVFNGTNPNGTWSLYVVDDFGALSGRITGGWCVNIYTSATK